MTNTPDPLEKIRAKCIEVNPEIVEYHPGDRLRTDGWVRTIRLADVLLAIYAQSPANKTLITLESDGQFVVTSYDNAGKKMELGPTWNLRKDSLEDQSPECITFISSILGVV